LHKSGPHFVVPAGASSNLTTVSPVMFQNFVFGTGFAAADNARRPVHMTASSAATGIIARFVFNARMRLVSDLLSN
jgi:hypothetical protein